MDWMKNGTYQIKLLITSLMRKESMNWDAESCLCFLISPPFVVAVVLSLLTSKKVNQC